jgi:multidrug efflux pump subunit AcrA (membrane-fusion protein)
MRTVVLGEPDGDLVVARDGVKAGERVIVDGQMKTRPGLRVAPTTETPAKAAGEGN